MQAIETLYKSNPEYFIYQKIQPALNSYNKKLLYKAFPETKKTKIFDPLTKRSFIEIQNNLLTSKYPILSLSFTMSRLVNSKMSKETFDEWQQTVREIEKSPITVREFQIITYLMRGTDFALALKKII